MKNWQIINKEEYEFIWNYIYREFSFKPHNDISDLISIQLPNRRFDISKFYDDNFNEVFYSNIHSAALQCFKMISRKERLYALDWQHDCYTFDPTLPFEKDEFNEWLIPVFPNGDYIFFFTKNLKNGIFSDGINQSITIFGDELISCFISINSDTNLTNCQ